MIKTPLSTVIGGAFWTPGATILGSSSKNLSQLIKSLFANNEQGFAYDPNDLSTMYQDAVGTIPVTSVGQPVGLIRDKSKGLTLGSNQISYPNSESLPAAVSMASGAYTWTLNTSAPISGTQDSRLIVTTPSSADLRPSLYFLCSSPLVSGRLYKFSFRYKVNSGAPRVVAVYKGDGIASVTPDNGVLQGSGTFDVFIRWVAGDQTIPFVYFSNESVFDLQINAISVREVKGNHAYQTTSASRPILRKNAITGANYLEFDGSDDFLQTGNIDFTATDKVSLFAGVDVPLGTNTGCVIELGTNATVNNGSFGLFKGPSTLQWASRGTSGVLGAIYNSPVSPDVLTAKAFINGSVLTTRRNSLLVINDTRSQGTGNYGNYPLYIGRRAGTSLPFNGHLYSLVGVGRLATESEIAAIEKELAKRTGVTLSV